jgi:hypothetical protein
MCRRDSEGMKGAREEEGRRKEALSIGGVYDGKTAKRVRKEWGVDHARSQ